MNVTKSKLAANEDAICAPVTAPVPFTFSNEVQRISKDPWVQLAPYGDWDNAAGMQRFQRDDADAIVEDFDSLGALPEKLLGLPWYVGHPDHPSFQDRYKDTQSYGRIKALEAREDGLYANVKWNKKGLELIEDEAFHGHSVNWAMVEDSTLPGIWRPRSLKSVGFTNEPAITVLPIVANEKGNPMPQWLLEMLGLGAEATEDDAKAALQAIIDAGAADSANADLQKEKEELESQVNSMNERIAAINTELEEAQAGAKDEAAKAAAANEKATKLEAEEAALRKSVVTLTEQFANERKTLISTLLDSAVADGRITPADRNDWEQKFAANEGADFADVRGKLEVVKPTIKTTSEVTNLRGRMVQAHDRHQQVQQFVNEKMQADSRLSYEDAFAAVRKEKPALFESMQQPAHMQS